MGFIHYSGIYVDLYELTMAQNYFLSGRVKETAVFDYYFRKTPFGAGYSIFAGLSDLLNILPEFTYSPDELTFLRKQGFHQDFLDYLESFHFSGEICSCQEGEIVFPNEPVLRVEGSLIETQLLETLVLNIINFESLVATKARRIKKVARERKLLDFGLRRAQGPGGYYAAKAAVIGGFDGTSNVMAGKDFNIPVSGTMAHSFIQCDVDELSAFRRYAQYEPQNCILLIDTFNTLKSGLPNAIQVAKEMKQKGNKLKGIRLDSGDLAKLARECRKSLDEENLQDVTIVASGQLDEFIIKSLLEQDAPIDAFGVGTRLVTGHPDAAIDGVYKLSMVDNSPRIKLSDSPEKMNFPGRKQILRLLDDGDNFLGADVAILEGEKNIFYLHDPFDRFPSVEIGQFRKEPLLSLQMSEGKKTFPSPTLKEIQSYVDRRLKKLPERYQLFEFPDQYLFGLSDDLKEQKDKLICHFKGEPYESTYHH